MAYLGSAVNFSREVSNGVCVVVLSVSYGGFDEQLTNNVQCVMALFKI